MVGGPGPSLIPELTQACLCPAAARMDLLEEIMTELQNTCHLEDERRPSPAPSLDS